MIIETYSSIYSAEGPRTWEARLGPVGFLTVFRIGKGSDSGTGSGSGMSFFFTWGVKCLPYGFLMIFGCYKRPCNVLCAETIVQESNHEAAWPQQSHQNQTLQPPLIPWIHYHPHWLLPLRPHPHYHPSPQGHHWRHHHRLQTILKQRWLYRQRIWRVCKVSGRLASHLYYVSKHPIYMLGLSCTHFKLWWTQPSILQ